MAHFFLMIFKVPVWRKCCLCGVS